MKVLAVVLLVCLLVTGTVSAITVFPGAVATPKAIKPGTVTVVQTTTPPPGPANGVTDTRGALLVYSDPSGAAITLDGSSTGDVTSQYYPLPAGSHTVKLSLSGYQDYTETFTITSHETWRINAPLKQKLPPSALQGVLVTKQAGVSYITVYVNMTPPALLTADGITISNDTWTNPMKLAFLPGTHTIVVWHPAYINYTVTLDLKAGMPTQYIEAKLKKIDTHAGLAQVMETQGVIQPGAVISPVPHLTRNDSSPLPPPVSTSGIITKGGQACAGCGEPPEPSGLANAAPWQAIVDFFTGLFGGKTTP